MKKWKAKLKNGQYIEENIEVQNWTEIKDEISELELIVNEQTIKLPPNMPEYIQGKTASANLINGKCIVESRYIGTKIGNNIVKIRVNEKTNNITIEIN